MPSKNVTPLLRPDDRWLGISEVIRITDSDVDGVLIATQKMGFPRGYKRPCNIIAPDGTAIGRIDFWPQSHVLAYLEKLGGAEGFRAALQVHRNKLAEHRARRRARVDAIRLRASATPQDTIH